MAHWPDPIGFARAKNETRRHDNEAQRALVATSLAKLGRGGDRRSKVSRDTLTQAQAAEALGVSRPSVLRAKAVAEHGIPELVAAVEAGEVPLEAAAEVAKLPEDEQRDAVAGGAKGVRAAAKRKPHRIQTRSGPDFRA